MNLKGRNFLKLLDYTEEEILYLLDLSKRFKQMKKDNILHKYLEGKNIVLLFEKTSTRTRCSFEVAGKDLGMGVTYLDAASSQMGKKESIRDTAKVLGRLYDGIEYRGYGQDIIEQLAKDAGVPTWNGLTDEFHPTQMIGDLFTIREHFGYLKGLNLTFVGDGRNNVANSLMVACAKMGINYTCLAPNELYPARSLFETCNEIATKNGSTITITSDLNKGVTNANILYTDVWVSMGEPEEIWEQRINMLEPYQVNQKMMELANENCIFLHCLPSFHDLNTTIGKEIYEKFGLREMEVTNDIFNSDKSLVFQEAENRMHTIKAIMYATMAAGDIDEK
ncbi:MAG: ornithine carbamoyltransferase [Bacilli bacterium]|nr:ornithine carbamoyltransferase [Bacilli bacterium]MDD4607990.1 ornithine carbamoyltransferase [Bacilli bacterium]